MNKPTTLRCILAAFVLFLIAFPEHAFAFKIGCASKPGYIVGFGQDGNKRCSQVPSGTDWVQISGGRLHNVAMRSNGTIAVWGANVAVYGDPNYPQFPVPDYNDTYLAVAAGIYHSTALRADGTLVSWGGCLEAPGDTPEILSAPDGNDFVQISAGGRSSCALRRDGSLVCWGTSGAQNEPSGDDFVAVECGNYMAYGLKSNGIVLGWGSDALDERAHLDSCGTAPDRCAQDPWFIPANWTAATNPTIKIAAGRYLYMFIRANGTLATGGREGTGAEYPTGCTGTPPNCYTWAWWQWPTDISLPLNTDPVTNPLSTGWIEVAPGGHHNLALRRVNGRNQMVLWGEGPPGYVDNDGSTIPMPGYGGRPPLAWNEEPSAVASGYYHSVAIVHRYPEGDINLDDKVDFGDFASFATKWLDNNIQPGYGLVSWHKLDDGSGTSAIDSSGNGHTGTLTETAGGMGLIWQPAGGHFAGALQFDGDGPAGLTNPYPRVAIPTAGMSTSAGTISMWVNLTDPPPVDKLSRAGELYFFGLKGSGTNDKIRIWVDNPPVLKLQIGNDSYTGTAYYTFNRASWYHIVLTWDNGTDKIYVNGSFVTQPTGVGTYTGFAALPATADIGNMGQTSYNKSMHGLVDDVRIYSYALPAGDIALTYGGALPSAFGHCTGLPEMDFDGDCKVGYSDLSMVLTNWLATNP